MLAGRGGDDADRALKPLADDGRAVDRIECDRHTDGAVGPGAELLALEDAGRVVLDAFADRHGAGDIDGVEQSSDGVAGGVVGGFLVALAHPLIRAERAGFGGADKLESDETLEIDGRNTLLGGRAGGGTTVFLRHAPVLFGRTIHAGSPGL